MREQELRDFLGSFNFSGDMATAKIAPFSGGEKALLALIIWQKPNLLLLDEPTNHLDLETRHALTIALAQLEGPLLFVSHDRHLLRAPTDTFMLVAKHRLNLSFLFPFDGYLNNIIATGSCNMQQKRVRRRRTQQATFRTTAALTAGSAPAVSAGAAKARAKKPLQTRIAKIEKEMEKLNAEKTALDAFVADPSSYEAAQKAKLTDTICRQGEVNARLETLEIEWLEAHEELEQIG